MTETKIIILIIVLLITGVVVGYLLYTKKDDKKENTKAASQYERIKSKDGSFSKGVRCAAGIKNTNWLVKDVATGCRNLCSRDSECAGYNINEVPASDGENKGKFKCEIQSTIKIDPSTCGNVKCTRATIQESDLVDGKGFSYYVKKSQGDEPPKPPGPVDNTCNPSSCWSDKSGCDTCSKIPNCGCKETDLGSSGSIWCCDPK